MILLSIFSAGALATANVPAREIADNPQINYSGFVQITSDLQDYRTNRLVSMSEFNRLSASPDAIILDTRSAAAFRQGHIKGAINIPFSDFTDEKLARYLGEKTRPILIYCNNNFRDNIAPVVRKRAELALNIPTFINLYGYGYRNIYELKDIVSISDTEVRWVKEAG